MSHIVDTSTFSGLFDLVASELRRKIMTGELPPGMPLRQRQLADMLGVSRDPIKHAVRALSNEGLVVKPPRRTAVVAPIREKSVRDVYEVRTQLDALAARTAAGLPDEVRKALHQRLQHSIEQAGREENAGQIVELDRQFHLFIYEAAGNEVALSAYHLAWTIIGRAMGLLVSTNHREKSWMEHERIVAAIADGDVALVGRLSGEHCESASRWLIENARDLMVADDTSSSELGLVSKEGGKL